MAWVERRFGSTVRAWIGDAAGFLAAALFIGGLFAMSGAA